MEILIFFLLLFGVVFAVFYNMGQKEKESSIVAAKTAEFHQRNAHAMAILEVLRKKRCSSGHATLPSHGRQSLLKGCPFAPCST